MNRSTENGNTGGGCCKNTSTFSGYAHLGVAIVGTMTNLTLIIVWIQTYRNAAKSRVNRRVRSNNHWFVLGMAVGDLLYCAIHASMLFDFYVLPSSFPAGKCALLLLSAIGPATATSLNLLMLNIDKFLYLCKPLRYSRMVTSKRSLAVTVGCWMVAFAWSLGAVFGSMTDLKGCDKVRVKHPIVYACYIIVFYLLPVCCSFCISIYIAFLVARVRDETAARKGGLTPTPPLLSSQQDLASVKGQPPTDAGRTARSESIDQLKRVAFIFVTTIWSTLTCLPYRLMYLLRQSCSLRSQPYLWLYVGLNVVMSLGALGNPLIILYTQPNYRRTLGQMFGRRSQSTDRINGEKPSSHSKSAYSLRSVNRDCLQPTAD